MAQVTHRKTSTGEHQIGVTIDKVFVPFATLAAANVAQLIENAKNREDAGADSGEGEES